MNGGGVAFATTGLDGISTLSTFGYTSQSSHHFSLFQADKSI